MNYKVEAWSWCADYCKKNQWNPHDSYFWNKANLEYRRQHNIFEVGDAVIRKWNGRLYYLIVDIDSDGKEFLIHRDRGAKFKDCRISDNICNFKHATDAEIEAGKRLEVNQ